MGLAGSKLGNYELLAEVARGSTTDLVLARTRGMAGFERHAVIKRVRDERMGDAGFVEAFLTEARLAATLHHHNIVQVQDIAQEAGVPFFAMEYVHGEDLRALLAHVHKAGTFVPIQHVLTIGCAVAAALHHAHEQRTPDGRPLNIVHRDVTPANILIGYDGNVKVVDFGMAKAAITSVTQVGIRKGKAPYMAPEQCASQRVDRRSDVFALGIVLYELITARRLFKGASDHDTMSTIVHGSIPPPLALRDDLPRELSSVVMKALARLPADRYQSAAELGSALETYASAAGVAPSTSALAAYLKQQLGERKEPWLPGGSVRPAPPVDWDGDQPGVASPAGEVALPSTRNPTMPAALARVSEPVVPAQPEPDDADDHDENEPTAADGLAQAKAQAAADAAKKPADKKLDVNAFAPKKLEPFPVVGKDRKDKTPIPSLVKPAEAKPAAPPQPAETKPAEAAPAKPADASGSKPRRLALTTPAKGMKVVAPVDRAQADLAAGWETKVDQSMPTRAKELDQKAVDDEMKAESSTTEMSVDQIQTNLASVGVAPPVVPTRPTPQPVAKIALVKKAPKPADAAPAGDDLAIPLEPPPSRGDTDLEIPTETRSPTEITKVRDDNELAATAAGRPQKKARAKSVTSETSPIAGGEIVAAEKPKGGDMTELVAPLPLELPTSAADDDFDPKQARRRRMILAGVGGAAVFAAIALVIAFSGGSTRSSQAATTAQKDDSEARPLAKHVDDDKEATGGQMTWNGVLDAGGGSAASAEPEPVKAQEPAGSAAAPEPVNEPEPAKPPEPTKPPEPVKEPEPAKKVVEPPPPPHEPIKKPEPVRAVKKPPPPKPHPVAKKPPVKKPPAKQDKSLKYDPNSLFLPK